MKQIKRNIGLSEEDKHCLKCFYHFRYGQNGVGCEFILVTGKRRGCDPGLNCKRFVEADPRLRWKLDEGAILKPGEVPGMGLVTAKPRPELIRIDEKAKPNTAYDKELVPLNIPLWETFRNQAKITNISRTTGYHEQTLYALKKQGVISRRIAQAILDAYGVDLIQK